MPSPRLRLTSLACLCVLGGACDRPSAPAPDRPVASASSPAPSAAAPPADSAPAAALPTMDPTPVRTAAPTASASASAPTPHPDAGAPKPAKQVVIADAGAGDAGAVAAADAGAAPPSEGQKIALAVDAIFAGRKTFSAHFKQQYTQRVTGTVKDSSGVVFVERPNKISFRYDPPSKNRIVSDGTTIKVYIADDNQMFETPVQKTQYPGALAFMMGNGIASSFDFTINSRAQYAGTILEGKPLTPNPSYETVMFYIGKEKLEKKDAGAIERVLILDSQGNKNRFDFEQSSQPATIDPAEFSFTPPPGTNITR